MKVVCAWCGEEIRNYDDSSEEVSHGICEKCLAKFLPREKDDDKGNINKN